VGHLSPRAGRNKHLELYLQTSDGHHYTLDLPQRLADSFDASAFSGQEVDVVVAADGRGGRMAGHQGRRLQVVEPPTLVMPASTPDVSSEVSEHHRRGLQQTLRGSGTGPTGSIRIIVFIMDLSLSTCTKAGPATNPQVRDSKNLNLDSKPSCLSKKDPMMHI
jgi:hypothetical protein